MKHVITFKYRNSDPSAPDALTYDGFVAMPRRGDVVSAGAGPDAEVSSVEFHYESNQVNVLIRFDSDMP